MFIPVVATLLVTYALFLVLPYCVQERLIFAGAKPDYLLYDQLSSYSITISRTEVKLQGWKIPANDQSSGMVALFFGGNGQDVATMHSTFAQLALNSVYAFNYRGYGLSEGQSSQAALYHDALLIYDTIARENPGKSITVIGQSLGSAVAGHVAIERNVAKLVLITPLSSITEIAQHRFRNIFPALLVKHEFDLHKIAPKIVAETLVITAELDSIIPERFSTKTYESLVAEKTLVGIAGVDHNTIFTSSTAILNINRFCQWT